MVCGGGSEEGWKWDGDIVLGAPWLAGAPLSIRFRHLYDLSLHRLCMVIAEMSTLGWAEGGEAWAWRQQLWA
jgi:hypothetical protein